MPAESARTLPALLLLTLAGVTAGAHDTFLLPQDSPAAANTPLTLFLNSGSDFPALEYGPSPARLTALTGRLGGEDVPVTVGEQRDDALLFTATAPAPGTLVVGLTLGARDIDLDAESVTHYFEEIRPSQAVRKAWAAQDDTLFREQYTKHAKALLCVQPCDTADAAMVPLGQALEFLPLDDGPIRAGAERSRFALLAGGEPLGHHALNFWTADGEHRALRTDGNGEVSVALDVTGPAMLSAVYLRPPEDPQARFTSDFATLTFVVAGTAASSVRAITMPPYDLVLSGGRVMDPETGLDAVRNVAIRGDRIAEISTEPLQGARVIDASGLVVAPGFIDLHAHGQTNQANAYQARDGVTTALELEGGIFPIREWIAEREGKALVNYGASASQLTARALAMPAYADLAAGRSRDGATTGAGEEDPLEALAPSVYEPVQGEAALRRMDALLMQALEGGALGIGLLVGYEPGATWEEILHLFRFAAAREVPIYAHVRDPGVPGIQEMIANAAATGAAVHIVHVNSMALGEIDHAIGLIAAAHERGLDVTTELYPYTAASTYLGSALFDGDWQARLGGIDYADLQWQDTGERLTPETFARYREQNGVVIIHMMKEAWIETGIAHPATMIASDGMPYAPGAHPRSAGTFARVLGRYVRERRVISLMTALAKMTIMPAKRLEAMAPAARGKGRLQVGADADITVFDPRTVIDTATFEGGLSFSEGIEYVLVNGVPVVADGASVPGVFPGRALLGRYRR